MVLVRFVPTTFALDINDLSRFDVLGHDQGGIPDKVRHELNGAASDVGEMELELSMVVIKDLARFSVGDLGIAKETDALFESVKVIRSFLIC